MFFILSKTISYITNPLVIVCLCFLLCALIKKQIWKKRFFITGLILLFFFSNDFIANEVMRLWQIEPTAYAQISKKYKYGVLLTGVTMGKLQPDDRVYFGKGADRVVHSMQLYKLGYIEKILVSGGNGRLIEIEEKEADELKKVLLLMGVKEEDILIENNSRNTHESAVEVKKIFEQQNIKPADCLLITSAFHMRRSAACFKKVGLDMDTFTTDMFIHPTFFTPDSLIVPSIDAFVIWTKLSKEWTGFMAYKVVGYI
jgi:uncharacterized SAM-binding protein YcdF (DUF218 family)